MYKGSVRNCKKKRARLPFITIVKCKFKTVSFMKMREGHGICEYISIRECFTVIKSPQDYI